MTFKSTKILLAIFTGLIAAPAYAGGLDEPIMMSEPAPVVQAQPVVQAPGWGGFYLGAQVGTFSYTDADDDVAVFVNYDGSFYGVHLGYLYDLGNFVIGAEFDYDILNIDEVEFGTSEPLTQQNIDEDGAIMRLKARAGYNLGRFLPYVTAGIARLELDFEDDAADGAFLGIGAAFKATENILVSGEFLRHQFNDAFDYDDYNVEFDTISLRGSYRF